jgi:hypothetical protein
VDAIFTPTLPPELSPVAVGVDLGWAGDRSAVVAVRRTLDGLLVVDHLLTWFPEASHKIDFTEVEEEVLTLARRYRSAIG